MSGYLEGVLVLLAIHSLTSGWSRRRLLGGLALAALGFVSVGPPVGAHLGGWLAGAALAGGGALVLYVALVRADLTMLPISVGAACALDALARGVHGAFSTVVIPSIVAAVLVALASRGLFRALRRAPREAPTPA